jgi:hypothetical protein
LEVLRPQRDSYRGVGLVRRGSCASLCLLLRCRLCLVLLGVAPFRSAPLGVLRPKPPWGRAWSPIWFFYCRYVLPPENQYFLGGTSKRGKKNSIQSKKNQDIEKKLPDAKKTVNDASGGYSGPRKAFRLRCINAHIARMSFPPWPGGSSLRPIGIEGAHAVV